MSRTSNTIVSDKERIEVLEAQIRQLMENNLSKNETQNSNQKESLDIRLDEMIPVVSLHPYGLSMMQLQNGKPKYRFNYFGEVKLILYQDLISLIESYRHFMEAGYFYIDNQKVVKRHGLEEIYSKLLTKVKIEEIVECKSTNSVTLYAFATDGQKNVINEFIIGKIRDSKQDVKKIFDMNFIRDISDIAGFDLVERGLKARENLKLMEEKEAEKE
jgi:hypothetical protein